MPRVVRIVFVPEWSGLDDGGEVVQFGDGAPVEGPQGAIPFGDPDHPLDGANDADFVALPALNVGSEAEEADLGGGERDLQLGLTIVAEAAVASAKFADGFFDGLGGFESFKGSTKELGPEGFERFAPGLGGRNKSVGDGSPAAGGKGKIEQAGNG